MVIGNKAPFIIVELLIRKKIPLTVGDKIASRHGHKGICCIVIPDDQMPADQWGFRADMCICPMSVPKRTNPGLIHEIEINRTAEWIVKFMDEKFATDEDKFNEIMDLYKMLYPTVGEDIEKTIRQAGQIPEYLQYCRDMGHIPLSGPPTARNINRHLPKKMRERFGMKTGPVVLAGYDRHGNIVKKRTKASVIIGKVYLYFINKGATPASPGFGYVTKLNQPINNDRDKDISFVRLAPYRFGEDDLRMLAAAGVHEEFNRLRNLFGNSTAGVDIVIETQLAHPNPIKIKKFPISNEKLYDHNQSLQAYFNYIRAAGVEVEKSLITEKVALPRIKETNDYMGKLLVSASVF